MLVLFDFIIIQHYIFTSDMKVMEVSTELSRFCPEGRSQYVASKHLRTAVFLPLGTTTKELYDSELEIIPVCSHLANTRNQSTTISCQLKFSVYFKSFVKKSLSVRMFKIV